MLSFQVAFRLVTAFGGLGRLGSGNADEIVFAENLPAAVGIAAQHHVEQGVLPLPARADMAGSNNVADAVLHLHGVVAHFGYGGRNAGVAHIAEKFQMLLIAVLHTLPSACTSSICRSGA